MSKKILLWISASIVASFVGFYFSKTQVEAPNVLSWALNMTPESIKISNKVLLPANYTTELIANINNKRQEKKISALTIDNDLNKAALARIAIISSLGDYTGTISSITREKSLELVGYDHTIIGDLFFVIKDTKDNVIEKAMNSSIESETILEPLFDNVGIADIQHEDVHYIYLILANKRKKIPPVTVPIKKPSIKISWGGPELWTAVNKRRVEFGVGQLTRKDELCTIASIRLNQLLDLGKLDGHAGFQPVLERSDLKWIGEKYNISEYLAQGYSTPDETVNGWENTLGHRSLLTGGEYVWGCIYSQNTYSVAITAY